MYINALGHYYPQQKIHNDYFHKVNGLDDRWIYERTGIKTRTKAPDGENTNTMGTDAVKAAAKGLPYPVETVDLIIGATYTPHDTIGTLAHHIQSIFRIKNAKAITVSSACSSLVNAMEIAEGYFATGKAKRALVVASEHNSAYNNETNEKSGHLWGDGAAAFFISREPMAAKDWKIEAIYTRGLGDVGKNTQGVSLHPLNGGLKMLHGKDVFVNAIKYMAAAVADITSKNGYELSDIDYLVPHQANTRIIKNIATALKIQPQKVLSNIEDLGNTGCASAGIALSQNQQKIRPNQLVALTVFGGGYSSGAMLIKA